MPAKFQQYKAFLKGSSSSAYHINKLRDLGVEIRIDEDADTLRLQIIDEPKEIPAFEKIESNIAERQKKLKWYVPDIVRNTAENIYMAFKAEQIVRGGQLSVLMPKSKKGVTAEVRLTIRTGEDKYIMEICDHYADMRILELAEGLDMTLDGSIAKLQST